MTATLLRQYTHHGILAGSQGRMQLGWETGKGVFVGMEKFPALSDVHHSGHIVFDALLGEKFSATEPSACPGRACPPRLRRSALTGHGSDLTVYASWNERPTYTAGSCSAG